MASWPDLLLCNQCQDFFRANSHHLNPSTEDSESDVQFLQFECCLCKTTEKWFKHVFTYLYHLMICISAQGASVESLIPRSHTLGFCKQKKLRRLLSTIFNPWRLSHSVALGTYHCTCNSIPQTQTKNDPRRGRLRCHHVTKRAPTLSMTSWSDTTSTPEPKMYRSTRYMIYVLKPKVSAAEYTL